MMFSLWKKAAPTVAADPVTIAHVAPNEAVNQDRMDRQWEHRFSVMEAELANTRRQVRVTWAVAACGSVFAFALGANPEARAQFDVTLASLDARLKVVEAKTASMSAITDSNTNQSTVRFTGVNVQVVSGAGHTDYPVNGTGNLIIGYNELRGGTGAEADIRTGSHNLVVGAINNYSSFGGAVIGAHSQIDGAYASVTGGLHNTATGVYSSVSGGVDGVASGGGSSVSGGTNLVANTTWGWAAGSRSGGSVFGNFKSP